MITIVQFSKYSGSPMQKSNRDAPANPSSISRARISVLRRFLPFNPVPCIILWALTRMNFSPLVSGRE